MIEPWNEKWVRCPKCDGRGFAYDDEGEEIECDLCEGRGECETSDERYNKYYEEHCIYEDF